MGSSSSKVHKIDNGFTAPLGIYNNLNHDYDWKHIRECILYRKLAPFYKGLPEPIEEVSLGDKKEKNSNETIECPICFLYYPSNINFTRCCKKPICTECVVQINYSFKESVHCPFCMNCKFMIHYQAPKALLNKGCDIDNNNCFMKICRIKTYPLDADVIYVGKNFKK